MKEVFDAIQDYAEAYGRLERLQPPEDDVLPVGDQKTGVIGDFFAHLYLTDLYPDSDVSYAKPSESGWDIKACKPGWALKIQVKAVSSYSKTSRVSPIHPGWDELYLMRLDRDFRPEAFWTVKKSDVEWSVGRLAHRTMPRRGQENSGSEQFHARADRFDDLMGIIQRVRKP